MAAYAADDDEIEALLVVDISVALRDRHEQILAILSSVSDMTIFIDISRF